MKFLQHKNAWFVGLGMFILLVFFCFRPLNTPQYRIVVADGLGYYAYLPAQFIYNDTKLEFKWFDEVFNANYEDHLFEKPTQNFMVKYDNRMINLYYPGQSFLQLPFFFMAHGCAKFFSYPADGFSLPYQIVMGLSGIFYTLLGLFFCSKLIFNISGNRGLSVLIPLLVFFATNLFTYSIFAGCYTHCYSFCFITLSLFFSERFFNTTTNRLNYLLLFGLSALVVVSLRPMNAVLLLSSFYFYKPFKLSELFQSPCNKRHLSLILIAIVLVAGYSMRILYVQTGALWANTYTIGRFYFNDWSHIAQNVLGFQNGILWYTPLIMICFIPLFFVRKQSKILFLLLPIFFVILMYSFWFYWNIVNRTLVDFSGILAVLLLVLFNRLNEQKRLYRPAIITAFLCVPFFQLKAYQLRNGILNNNYTYWRYYVKHFFTLHHVDVFPVNPKTILQQQDYFYDFENEPGPLVSPERSHSGKLAAVLNEQVDFNCTKKAAIPDFFAQKGFKKIKVSFWLYRGEEIENIHLVFNYLKNDTVVLYHPFYINSSTPANDWEYKEFGMDLPEGLDPSYLFTVYLWNPDKRKTAFIDDFKLEFILKDGSDEITLEK